jgi:hypothetical protein
MIEQGNHITMAEINIWSVYEGTADTVPVARLRHVVPKTGRGSNGVSPGKIGHQIWTVLGAQNLFNEGRGIMHDGIAG